VALDGLSHRLSVRAIDDHTFLLAATPAVTEGGTMTSVNRELETAYRRSAGFTLVELLVALRSSAFGRAVGAGNTSCPGGARQAQCRANIKNLAYGCLLHEERQGFLPSNGWDARWIGDPDRGFGREQPGGWAYNILPVH